jgi:hypothetical protein
MIQITDQYRFELEQRFEAWRPADEDGRRFLRLCLSVPELREMWLAGEWLADRLRERGAEPNTVKDVSFAFGQRCFGAPDVWSVAEQSLAKFDRGNPDVPGAALADEVCRETLPELFQ